MSPEQRSDDGPTRVEPSSYRPANRGERGNIPRRGNPETRRPSPACGEYTPRARMLISHVLFLTRRSESCLTIMTCHVCMYVCMYVLDEDDCHGLYYIPLSNCARWRDEIDPGRAAHCAQFLQVFKLSDCTRIRIFIDKTLRTIYTSIRCYESSSIIFYLYF